MFVWQLQTEELVIDDSRGTESQGLVNGYSLTLGNGHGLVVCWFTHQVNKSLLFYQHDQKCDAYN